MAEKDVTKICCGHSEVQGSEILGGLLMVRVVHFSVGGKSELLERSIL